MDLHMERLPVALVYCSADSCVLAEQGTQGVVLNNFQADRRDRDPQEQQGDGSCCCLVPQKPLQDRDPSQLQWEGSHCCLVPQKPRLDRDPQLHQAEGHELSQEE